MTYAQEYYLRVKADPVRLKDLKEKQRIREIKRNGDPEKKKHRRITAALWRARTGFKKVRTNPDRIRQQERERSALPENKAKRNLRARTRYWANKGKIPWNPCEICGDTNSEAHHDDYSKPLQVRWLCHKHHMALHRKDPEARVLTD